jgi:hypothetical protein
MNSRPIHRTVLAVFSAAALITSSPALAQSNISPGTKFAWSENCGWINFRDAGTPAGTQGVRINASFLSGFAYAENVGFINLGSGAPANSVNYANPTSGSVAGVPEFGVNRDTVTNQLSGYAWGENIGWVNFAGGALASPPNPARYDTAAKRLRGYAWAENIGWINLDDAAAFVGTCAADFNNSGAVTVQDIFDFLTAWFSGDMLSDFNSSGAVTVQDVFDFLSAWFQGCA